MFELCAEPLHRQDMRGNRTSILRYTRNQRLPGLRMDL